ncbi:hypothetical protein [Luteimonas terrae]|uniref:DUF2793 domain-containing protein n=1 Tax=Luteimonas terrae TaxID=1530191 RepID=A0ABU1XVT0_9GAMM|nr:hypothetical protein [Luteimonas terrae]MDR7192718.1 hypothetical protein [Luteimonas terrae]
MSISLRATRCRMMIAMPSRHATKAALRRSREPLVIPPEGLAEMPSLGHSIFNDRGWRNPVVGDDYVRTEWQAFSSAPGCSGTLARVVLAAEGAFKVSSGESFAMVADPQVALELAAGWAMARLEP